MKECVNSKIHLNNNFIRMSSNNVRHLITRSITTLQHFATLHHTSPNHTSLHLCIQFCNKLSQIIQFLTLVAETLNQINLLENNVSCFAVQTATFFLPQWLIVRLLYRNMQQAVLTFKNRASYI
jgi:hypothetical protein